MIPPPTPNSAEKTPATRPMRASRAVMGSRSDRTARILGRPCPTTSLRAARRRARARCDPARRRRHAGSDRRSARGRPRPGRGARASSARLAERYALVACVSGRPGDAGRADDRRPWGVDRRGARSRARPGRSGVGREDRRVRARRRLAGRAEAADASRSTSAAPTTRPRRAPTSHAWPRPPRPRAWSRAGGGWCSRSGRRSRRTRAPRSGRWSRGRGSSARSTPATTGRTWTRSPGSTGSSSACASRSTRREAPAELLEAADLVVDGPTACSSCAL